MPIPQSQMGGCEPVSAPKGAAQSIRARVYELTQLSPEDYRGVIVPLYATCGPGVVSGSDTYRVPTTHELAIYQIGGLLTLDNYLTEYKTVVDAGDATRGFGDPDLVGRVLMKAMNAMVDLKNSDREQKLIDNHPTPLSTLLRVVGGNVIDWSAAPHIVPAGETLTMSVTLTNQDVKMLGGNTKYGVVLLGHLIRVAKS